MENVTNYEIPNQPISGDDDLLSPDLIYAAKRTTARITMYQHALSYSSLITQKDRGIIDPSVMRTTVGKHAANAINMAYQNAATVALADYLQMIRSALSLYDTPSESIDVNHWVFKQFFDACCELETACSNDDLTAYYSSNLDDARIQNVVSWAEHPSGWQSLPIFQEIDKVKSSLIMLFVVDDCEATRAGFQDALFDLRGLSENGLDMDAHVFIKDFERGTH